MSTATLPTSRLTDRERFHAVLFNGPLYPADATVVLSGDGYTRLASAMEVVRQAAITHANDRDADGPFAATLVLSGGLHEPPYSIDAEHLVGPLLDKGFKPGWLRVESDSQNTHESAEAIVEMAKEEDWHRILLVTSAYHMSRAFLTVLASVQKAGLADSLHVCALPCAQAWWQVPEGLGVTRLALMDAEAEKVEAYRALGHVASYEDGLAYLEAWEGR